LDDFADETGGMAIADDDGDEANTTCETMTIPAKAAIRTPVIEQDEAWENTELVSTPSSQPVLVETPREFGRNRPGVSERTRTESWVQTGRKEYEAPNGGSVV